MCLGRVARPTDVDVLELARQRLQDRPRAVVRDVVDGVDVIAELGDVPDRALDEDVLVADEDAADDRGHVSSDSSRCSSPSSRRCARTAYDSSSAAASAA